MGRQVHISVLPEDVEELFSYIKSRPRVVVVKRDDPDSATVKPLVSQAANANETLILWNQELPPELRRKLVSREAAGDCYRVDEFVEPVLEFGDSCLRQWCN
jgi:hypothetical protein